jgi:hypothetical protein
MSGPNRDTAASSGHRQWIASAATGVAVTAFATCVFSFMLHGPWRGVLVTAASCGLTPRCSGPQGWPSAIPVAAELER